MLKNNYIRNGSDSSSGGSSSSSSGGDSGYTCIPYEDCTDRNNAEAALKLAQLNLTNAEDMLKTLNKERTTTTEMMGAYKSVYNALINSGKTVSNPKNMNPMSEMIECVSNYGQALDTACSQCETEIENLQKAVEAAQEKYDNTPCVTRCR